MPPGADFLRSASQPRPHTSVKQVNFCPPHFTINTIFYIIVFIYGCCYYSQVQTELTCQRIQELETQASSDLEVRNNKIDELTRSNEELKHQVQAQSKVIQRFDIILLKPA